MATTQTKTRAAGAKAAANGAEMSRGMKLATDRVTRAEEQFARAKTKLDEAKALLKDLRTREKAGAGGQRKGG